MRLKTADTSELNSLSMLRVAEDWGIETVPRARRGLYTIKCPDPKHSDKNLGNCLLTDDGHRNSFHCFACGAKGGPIDFVMLVSKCDFGEAKDLLAVRYGKVKEIDADPMKNMQWQGLTTDEYAMLGMKNISLQNPYKMNEWEEAVYQNERISLREFAKEDPKLHDDILLGKYVEKMDSLILARDLLEVDAFRNVGISFQFDKSWEQAFAILTKRYRKLLYKGLMDKTIYPFTQEDMEPLEDELADTTDQTQSEAERKLEEAVVKTLFGKQKKIKKRSA